MSVNKKSFKTELKISLLKNSLVYVFAISLIGFLIAVGIFGYNAYNVVRGDSVEVAHIIEKTIDGYVDVVEKDYDKDYFQNINEDREVLSNEYHKFLDIVNAMPIKADFYVFDKDFNVLIQSQYPADFSLSTQQQTKNWSTFGKIWSNPDSVKIEISKDFRPMQKTNDLVIGKAISSEDKVRGYIVFCIDESSIEEILSLSSSNIVLANKNDSVLASTSILYSDLSNYEKAEFNRYTIANSTLFYKLKVNNGLLEVYSFMDLNKLTTYSIMALMCLLSILTILTFALFRASDKFSIEKTANLDEIIRTIRLVESEGLNRRMPEFDVMEFNELSLEYNKMFDDIEMLMKINEQKTQENFISLIKQLEMQFNSHFLFNTLENIRFMIKSMPDKAMQCIVNLAEILRYSINNENENVAIAEDITYTERYLDIIKLRFGQRLSYTLDVEEKAKNYIVPKLIIQPIIENAVKYAYGDNEKLNIQISVKVSKGRLVIKITDDGVGISPKELKKIRENITDNMNKSNHIGLHNVNKRIKLIYGEDFGIEVSSVKHKGTTVKLVCGNLEKKNDKDINS